MNTLGLLLLWWAFGQQSAPTMDETTDWLTRNLPTKANYSGGVGEGSFIFSVTDAKIADCVCRLKMTLQIGTKAGLIRPMVTPTEETIPMTAIDPASIRIETNTEPTPAMRVLYLRTEKQAKQIQSVNGTSRMATMKDMVTLYFSDAETAQRFQKAFTHLATLCRQSAKKEPF